MNLNNKVLLNITGRKVRRFLIKLNSLKIDVYDIRIKNEDSLSVLIDYKLYDQVIKNKGIYNIEIIGYKGIQYYKNVLSKLKYLIIFSILGIVSLCILSNIIFSVEISHKNKELRQLLTKEMNNYGLKKYTFKKSYDEIEKIEEKIINSYKDQIEWLEISTVGTKYIVKVEERLIPKNKEKSSNKDVVSTKNGVIKKIDASSGEVSVKIGDYVKKGDILISGAIKSGEAIKGYTEAKGNIYAETWYISKVEFPLNYREKSYTGKSKKLITFKFLDNLLNLFNFNAYNTKEDNITYLYHDLLLPIGIGINKQRETREINEFYTEDTAILKANLVAEEKIKNNLENDEYIISKKTLNFLSNDSRIELEIFFTVYENISKQEDINLGEFETKEE